MQEQNNLMTSSFKKSVSFDKKEIRQQIIIPTFRQARRCADIYTALTLEFYEDACPTSAKYFQILIDKERTLFGSAAIRDRFSDEPSFLLKLFDNCKMAEKAAILGKCDGPATCSRLLLQCILMFENYDKKYDWILMDVFKIIIKIASKVCQAEDVSKESLCQIYYRFGIFLTKSDLEEAVKFLEKSFVLSKGTNWIDNENNSGGKSLHLSSVIAKTYATALLNYANDIFYTAPGMAISQAQKALVILTGEGIERNKSLYIKANLDMAHFQLEDKNYELSLSKLENIAEYIKPSKVDNLEYLKFLARYNHLKGVCLKSLNKYDMALAELNKALKIIRQLNLKYEEGIITLDMAKVYMARGRSQFSMAEFCLRQSKEIFVALNDVFNTKKTSYLMANLRVQNIQPIIFDLIKFSSSNYCDKYRLNRWKSICLPFWRNLQDSLENEERYPLNCLMKATEIPGKKGKRKSFQRRAPQN